MPNEVVGASAWQPPHDDSNANKNGTCHSPSMCVHVLSPMQAKMIPGYLLPLRRSYVAWTVYPGRAPTLLCNLGSYTIMCGLLHLPKAVWLVPEMRSHHLQPPTGKSGHVGIDMSLSAFLLRLPSSSGYRLNKSSAKEYSRRWERSTSITRRESVCIMLAGYVAEIVMSTHHAFISSVELSPYILEWEYHSSGTFLFCMFS